MGSELSLEQVQNWLKINGYHATLSQLKQEVMGYSSAAAQKFRGTQGKSFKKQMMKNKKASWRGVGAITNDSRSIKFDD